MLTKMVVNFRLIATTTIALLILAAETGRWLLITDIFLFVLSYDPNQSRASLMELAKLRSKQIPSHLGPAKVSVNHLLPPGSHLDFPSLLQDPPPSHLDLVELHLAGALHKSAQHLINFSSDRTQLLWSVPQKPS